MNAYSAILRMSASDRRTALIRAFDLLIEQVRQMQKVVGG
jgi:hypothetical protein